MTVNPSYSTMNLPQYVLHAVCVDWKDHRHVKLTRAQDNWILTGSRTSLTVKAPDAPQARRALCDLVSEQQPKTDRRRRKWYYT